MQSPGLAEDSWGWPLCQQCLWLMGHLCAMGLWANARDQPLVLHSTVCCMQRVKEPQGF